MVSPMNNADTTDQQVVLDFAALGLNVETVFEGADEACPSCSVLKELPLAA